jgi:protein gp37
MIFVNAMSDLFHPNVPSTFIAAMFGVMALAPNHVFQILTKREDRMVRFFKEMASNTPPTSTMLQTCLSQLALYEKQNREKGVGFPIELPPELVSGDVQLKWPLNNVWIGVSVENQRYAHDRVPALRKTPATVRFLSMEPLVGAVKHLDLTKIDWVIAGGETGPNARPMSPDWIRTVRDACVDQEVPFMFKGWGQHDENGVKALSKKTTGAMLDGIEYKQWPEVR